MSELEEKVKRIEKLLLLTWKLAKAVKRAHNSVTGVFNGNFDIMNDDIHRNAENIDQMVNTLRELMGEEAIIKQGASAKKINQDCKMMFL